MLKMLLRRLLCIAITALCAVWACREKATFALIDDAIGTFGLFERLKALVFRSMRI